MQRLTATLIISAVLASFVAAQDLPVLLREDFQSGMERWEPSDKDLESSVWKIAGEGEEKYLRVTGKSKYKPPVRSPHSICWLKDVVVGDFEVSVKVQNTNPKAGGHRDLCLFWGRKDASHFYYVHLGAKPDPHSCQIFIVNGEDRKMITENETKGTPWTDGWHTVRVKRRVADGLIEVYFDDMEKPRMIAHDKTFAAGPIGIGTFDDNGNFDNLELRGVKMDAE